MNNDKPDQSMMTDEMMMAFLDGELSPSSRVEFEQALQNDSEMRNKVEQYKQNDLLLMQSLNAATETALPDIPLPAAEKKPDTRELKSTVKGSVLNSAADWFFRPALAFYTIATLGLGIAIGNIFPVQSKGLFSDQKVFEQAQVVSAAINMALEQELSGTRYNWSNIQAGSKGGVTPLKTWKNQDNQYCREFKLELTLSGSDSFLTATACRVSSGYWKPHPPIDRILWST